jgi:hypothetical protein
MRRRLRAGEMAHQKRDAVVLRADARRQRRRFVGGDAEPVHAGVDVQRRAAVPLAGGDKSVPFGQFEQVPDHRPRTDVGEGGPGAGHQAVQDVEGRVRGGCARAPRLVEIGDEECPAAGADERLGDRPKPAAIAVGLDHRRAFRRQRAVAENAPVLGERREIDREHAAGFGGCRAGGQRRLLRRHLGSGTGGGDRFSVRHDEMV